MCCNVYFQFTGKTYERKHRYHRFGRNETHERKQFKLWKVERLGFKRQRLTIAATSEWRQVDQ